MKKFIGSLVLLFVFFAGCRHDMPVEPPSGNPDVILGKLAISVSNKTLAAGDTVVILVNTKVIFRAVGLDPAIKWSSWEWIFSDSSHVLDSIAVKEFNGTPGSLATVKLIGTASTGQVHSITVNLLLTLSGGYDLVISPLVPLGNNTAQLTMFARTEPLAAYAGNNIYYTGDMNSWDATFVSKKRYWSSDSTSLDTSGVAPYVMIKFIVTPKIYHMGIGKIDSIDGVKKWAKFFSQYCVGTDIGFKVNSDWTITTVTTTTSSLPGYLGDVGDTAVIRFTPLTDKLLIYVNLGKEFVGSPFIRRQNLLTGKFLNPIPEIAVTSSPNWGVASINYADVPDGILSLRVGLNSSIPDDYLGIPIEKSGFFDKKYLVLKAQIISVAPPGKNTSQRTFTVVRYN
ncbi:MAG: hypothetical protein WC863_04185 [Patescibacteria group bacterium]